MALACLLAPAGSVAWAQSGPGLRITPTLGGDVSYIDRSGLGAVGSGSDVVTQLRPGLQITTHSGKVRGTLFYELDAIHHTNAQSGNVQNIQNRLSGNLNAEVIDNVFFVDATADVSQVAVSPYGVQSFNGTVANDNRTEVATLSVTPRLRGNVGGYAVYELSLIGQATNGRRSVAADGHTLGAVLSLNSPSSGAVFGWGLQGSTQESSFRAGRTTRNDRYTLSLNARPDTDLRLTVRAGQESTDVLGVTKQSYDNYGAELLWTPSPRTTVNLATDKRYFGNSRQITLEHRFQRSLIRFTSIRGASGGNGAFGGNGFNNAGGTGIGQPISLYQLFYEQFASIQPDPVLREQLVLNFLRAQGLDPQQVIGGGFINNAVTLDRREDLAYSLIGIRNTLSLQAFRSTTSVLDTIGQSQAPSGGLGNGSGNVRQHGFTATLSHRLTPTATASVSASLIRTASSGTQVGNGLRTLNLILSEQLTRMVSASLSARYSDFDSPTLPYRETALTASFNVRF